MNKMLIRSFIFFTAGLIVIVFRKPLNSLKNRILIKLKFKPIDERKSYIRLGIIFIIVAVILFIYSKI